MLGESRQEIFHSTALRIHHKYFPVRIELLSFVDRLSFFAFRRPLRKCLILMYLDIMRIKHELSCHRRDGLLGTPKNIIFCVSIWTCSVEYYLIKAKSQFKDHGTYSAERQHTQAHSICPVSILWPLRCENENIFNTHRTMSANISSLSLID